MQNIEYKRVLDQTKDPSEFRFTVSNFVVTPAVGDPLPLSSPASPGNDGNDPVQQKEHRSIHGHFTKLIRRFPP